MTSLCFGSIAGQQADDAKSVSSNTRYRVDINLVPTIDSLGVHQCFIRSKLYLLGTTCTQRHLSLSRHAGLKVKPYFLLSEGSTSRVPRTISWSFTWKVTRKYRRVDALPETNTNRPLMAAFVKMALDADPDIAVIRVRGTLYRRDPPVLTWHWHLSHIHSCIDGCRGRHEIGKPLACRLSSKSLQSDFAHFLHVRGASRGLLA